MSLHDALRWKPKHGKEKEEKELTCKQCFYWWKDIEEDWPCCHYTGPDDLAPCAQEEDDGDD